LNIPIKNVLIDKPSFRDDRIRIPRGVPSLRYQQESTFSKAPLRVWPK
jgi:hypothetical protein